MGADFEATLLARARVAARRVVLSEGDDSRVREAGRELAQRGIATVTLLGGGQTATWAAAEAPGVSVRTPAEDPLLGAVADHLRARKPDKAPSREAALEAARDPLRFAAALVALGEADATVGGASHSTGDVLRAAFWAVGPASGIATVSSAFYMVTRTHGVLTFTDAGVVQYPTAEQLADIAIAAVHDRTSIVGDAPRVAFLSHSTLGSAEGDSVTRVREAVARFRALAPDVPAEGELQADAALIPEVHARKARGGALEGAGGVGGLANILVFPDLDSGNIAYKLVQRLGGATAIGPIVQGLARPCCDLSRGASAADIVLVAAIAALQAS